jgi:hypothetical protein
MYWWRARVCAARPAPAAPMRCTGSFHRGAGVWSAPRVSPVHQCTRLFGASAERTEHGVFRR